MRKLGVLLIALLGLLLFVGCGDDTDDETGSNARISSPGHSSYSAVPAPAIAPGRREQSPSLEQDTSAQAAERKEVVTGQVDITAGDPLAAAATVVDRVTELKGRVDSRTEQPGTDDEQPRAELTVRIPADRTDAFIDGLESIGELTEITTNRDDVTMRWQDLDARIAALRASVDRLRALMSNATNTADLIAAEEALSTRQGELDSLTGQKRLLDDQIALSTLTITIGSDDDKDDDGPTNFWTGVVAGWDSLVDWLQDAVVVAGKAVPWAGFLAVIGVICWGIVRLVRRPNRTRPADTKTPAETGATRADNGSSDDQAEQS